MIGRPDADGKFPLSGNEYYAIREIFAVISALDSALGYLKDRAKLTPGTWRDLCAVMKLSQKALDQLLRSVPVKKLVQIKSDIERTVVSVEVKPPHGVGLPKDPDFVCIPAPTLDYLIGIVMDIECFACEKRGREIKKCPIRPAIEDTFPFEIPEPENDGCKFCNYHIDHDNKQYEEGEQIYA